MCEQCEAKTLNYSKAEDDTFLGKYHLVKATKDGYSMKAGDWGLVEVNDPDFIFSVTPWPSPWVDCTENELDSLSGEDSKEDIRWTHAADKFIQEVYDSGCFRTTAELVFLCQKNGYVEHTTKPLTETIQHWLFHHLGVYMMTHSEPLEDNV